MKRGVSSLNSLVSPHTPSPPPQPGAQTSHSSKLVSRHYLPLLPSSFLPYLHPALSFPSFLTHVLRGPIAARH